MKGKSVIKTQQDVKEIKMEKLLVSFAVLVLAVFLSACSTDSKANGEEMATDSENGHSHMILEGTSEVPEGLKAAEDPAYPMGSYAISKATHMDGMMMDAEVEIVGAFETTAYVTSYTPADHPRIENHKWIVQEEFVNAGNEVLTPGTEVKTTANHMMGMQEAVQEIVSSKETTVYMVNFTMSNGQKVTNHKWVIEEELKPLN